MNEEEIREAWHRNPTFKINISTKLRKTILLSNDTTIMYEGHLYDIKFKNKGGGVWEAYTEGKIYQNQQKLNNDR